MDDKARLISYKESKNEYGNPYFESMDIRHVIFDDCTLTVNKNMNIRCFNSKHTLNVILDDLDMAITYDSKLGLLFIIDNTSGRQIYTNMRGLKKTLAREGKPFSEIKRILTGWPKNTHRTN